MRLRWVVLAALAGACSEPKLPPRGLRVPLPEGWVANPGAPGVLQVGPKGRAVLTLERRSAKLPTLETLQAAVESEGGAVVRGGGAVDSTTVRYRRAAALGLLTVRTLEHGALLLCASTPEARQDELDPADTLCAAVRLEPAAR